jgi:DNA-binding NarL/FixJ family response regulator
MLKNLYQYLIASRSPDIITEGKLLLKRIGVFNAQGVTEGGKALNRVINRTKPRLVFLESSFYSISTPYMAGQMLKKMPKLRIAVFSLGEYPVELEMKFIFHGAEGYISLRDGTAEFYHGIEKLCRGEQFVCRRVREKIDELDEAPVLRLDDSEREDEVLRLLAEGLTTDEIAKALNIGFRTVERHKTKMFIRYHARNTTELIRYGAASGKVKFPGYVIEEDVC